jgi:cytochrome c oxidase cbb3-type subunit III
MLIPIVLCLLGQARGQESTAAITNPFNSEADVARGEATFRSQCASCHGKDGRGGAQGPDLSTGSFRRATTDESLFQIINKGIPGTVMPAFALNPGPAWQVVAYIRSLALARQNQRAAGDAGRGEELFRANGCGKCHLASGPDLASIGRKRTRAELRQSLIDPQADVPSAWWRFKAVTRDGRQLAGMRLNEDTFTIQYRDQAGKLRSVARSDLATVDFERKSPMPSYAGKLSEEQIQDLLSYLVTRVAQ